MATEILMPALSPTMEEGTLAKWLVKEGDTVSSGDVLAEIETDKATMEFEAVDEGIMGPILVGDGTAGVKVNTPIAVILEEGESADDLPSPTAPTAAAPAKDEEVPSKATPKVVAAPQRQAERVFASPLARRIASDAGIDLAQIKGSGPHGRIVKSDVENSKSTSEQPVSSAPAAPQPASAGEVAAIYADRKYEEISLDGMRRTIAARLTEAKQTIPHFYLRRSIRLDELLAFRKQLNNALQARGVKISVNDLIIKASALALQEVPDCNAVWAGDRILKLTPSDVAVAVAIEGGLFTPVIKDADKKPVSEISTEMKDLAERARSRRLAPHEYQGGSFAISNLGMFGIENFDAVINPPHGSILAVGAGQRAPVVQEDGSVGVETVMSVTLSVDHRVIDGALGAEFLIALARHLENPLGMLA